MVYIAPDGSVHSSQPWSVRRVTDVFWGAVAFVCMFVQSILEPLTTLSNGGTSRSGTATSFRNSRGSGSNSGGGGGGGGGGGSGFFGGGGGGRGPPANRRMGRINTTPSCSVPGGCCGQ